MSMFFLENGNYLNISAFFCTEITPEFGCKSTILDKSCRSWSEEKQDQHPVKESASSEG
jgi:hypothetical protein